MPRPGIEPGLEVPETSVMSFSLPGLSFADLINISGSGAGQARLRHLIVAQLWGSPQRVFWGSLSSQKFFGDCQKWNGKLYLKKAHRRPTLGKSDEIPVSKLPDLRSDPCKTLARIDEHQALRTEIA